MSIGIVVDGIAERSALGEIIKKVPGHAGRILSPLYADMQPGAPCAQIVRAAESCINILQSRGADQFLILIDREDNTSCPPSLAAAIVRAFDDQGLDVGVVVKDCCFENWLIADPGAFRKFPARYNVTGAFECAVRPNKADHESNPRQLINRVVRQRARNFHKRRDAKALAEKLNIVEVGKNSRSFRRFLRLLEHPRYIAQSKLP